ncbi:ABC transporter permease [Enterococcus sp. BWR-S5]|uniref:ABC transporter permease n=1 Tax=Enterococcus sp. BWR-S5 TaxID=2787714 RepID=UPI001923A3DE|nr:ABC transporter permease [Enterococcus sp. BWR-S5]MBL1225597.1 FtsX-like permease family protein [Enterococcus sp. BWR-S5]
MKQILRKDLLREIKYSFMRFVSIAALIALGTSFFIGLKSAAPNILATGSSYFDRFHYYDARMISADGITEDQAEAFQKLDIVAKVELKQMVHQIIEPSGLTIEMDTFEDGQYELIKGREPKAANEILLDEKAQEYFALDEFVTVGGAPNEEQKIFKDSAFKVVGFANSYRFISKNNRGITTIGNGELTLFGAVLSSSFSEQGYNVLDIQLTEEFRNKDRFSESYSNQLAEAKLMLHEMRLEQQEEMKQSFEEELSEKEAQLESERKDVEALISQLDGQIKEATISMANLPSDMSQLPADSIQQPTNDIIAELTAERNKGLEAKSQLEEKEKELADVRNAYREPTFDLQGIDETVTFSSFKENIQCLDALGNILPIIFYFVACLITVSIITRMIDQERKQIGTLKALGVKSHLIIRKYSTYSLLSGSAGFAIGLLIGCFLFPTLLIRLYSPLYIFKEYDLIIYWPLVTIAGIASLLSIVIIPYFFYRNTLKSPPLHLMRRKPPVSGKAIFLEKLPFFWNRCSFSAKMGLRNIFRYKMQMLLLSIGITGCMVLLVTGYGAREAVSLLQEQQFDKVLNYDMITVFHTNANAEEKSSYRQLTQSKELQTLGTIQEKWETSLKNGKSVQINTIVPISESKKNQLSEYIKLTDSITKQPITISPKDAVVTEKLAQLLNITVNDRLKIKNSANEDVEVTITHIADNYYLHYLYLGTEIYKNQISEELLPNMELIRYDRLTTEDKVKILEEKALTSLTTVDQMSEQMTELTAQLDRLIAIVIIAAIVLGIVVIYNLSYINILERKQELSVVYAMGYRPLKRTFYIFREMIILGVLSMLIGYGVGVPIYQLIMKQLELEFLKFPEPIYWQIFLQSSVTLVVVFCILLILMHYKIGKVDVLGALKDRE